MEKPLVSIGVPIYNAEEFLLQRVESLVNQTYKNIEIIISDNASSDNSQKICEKFAIKDSRIRYFRQEENKGSAWNFSNVLENAKGEYFTWAAMDDIILPEYLENTIPILEKNDDVSCCASQIELFGSESEYLKIKETDSLFQKIKKKISQRYGYMKTFPTEGNFEKRLRQYLKKARHNQIFYSVYRTEQIKKCYVNEPFIWNDSATIINILKFGNLHVVEKTLMRIYDGGASRSGLNAVSFQMKIRDLGKILPYYDYTIWCYHKLGTKLFFRNMDYFLKINVSGLISVIITMYNSRRKQSFE